LRRKRRLIVAGIALLAAGGAIWWINERRTASWGEMLNPAYWVRRARGDDLFDDKNRILFNGNRSRKEIALTFDDGPHSPTCEKLLDVLKQENVRATFFLVGRRIRERPDHVVRMMDEGHELANHSQNHYRLPGLKPDQLRREINDPDIELYRVSGRHMGLLRPPGVQYDEKVLAATRELGYITVAGSVAAMDFQDVSAEFIARRVILRTTNGSIILLHDERQETVEALPNIIRELRRQGYQFVTVGEMLSRLPRPVTLETEGNTGRGGNPAGVSTRNR
jgi:peptidoglycan/xylan/chitin deacetylase (PgdA/CDA1 family)